MRTKLAKREWSALFTIAAVDDYFVGRSWIVIVLCQVAIWLDTDHSFF